MYRKILHVEDNNVRRELLDLDSFSDLGVRFDSKLTVFRTY